MRGEDFIAVFRREMRDETWPYLVGDDDILAYVSEAEREACERARLLEDASTADVCTLALTAGTGSYALHESVLAVKRVTVAGRPLDESSVEDEDANGSAWETASGTPRRYIQGEGALRLVPAPAAAAEALLTVYRLPLADITDLADPEIPTRFHMRLMPWVYRCVHLKRDSQFYDPQLAAQREAEFEASFGPRVDANVQRKRRDRRTPVVRCSW